MLRHEIPHYKDKKHNNSAINTINTTTTTTATTTTTTLLLLFLSKIKIIFLIKCILKMKLKLQVMRHFALHSVEFLFLLFFFFFVFHQSTGSDFPRAFLNICVRPQLFPRSCNSDATYRGANNTSAIIKSLFGPIYWNAFSPRLTSKPAAAHLLIKYPPKTRKTIKKPWRR